MSSPRKNPKPAQAAAASIFEVEPWATLLAGFLFAAGAYGFDKLVDAFGEDEEDDQEY